MNSYAQIYRDATVDKAGFWLDAATAIDWVRAPKTGLDDSDTPFYRWFPDGEMNSCFNTVDRHVLAGRGDQNAIIYDSPITEIGRAHVRTPVTEKSRMPSSA